MVVFIEFYAFFGEEAFKAFEVFVGEGGAAVEEEDFDAGIVAEAFGPYFKVSGGGLDGDHFYAGGLDGGVGVIEVLGEGWGVRFWVVVGAGSDEGDSK